MTNKHWHDQQQREDVEVIHRFNQVLIKLDRLLSLDTLDIVHPPALKAIRDDLVRMRGQYTRD